MTAPQYVCNQVFRKRSGASMRNDSRLFAAFPYRANAVLICLPRLYDVALIDISMHAALIAFEGTAEIRPGDQAPLRVLTEKGNQAFEVPARVAHRTGSRIALAIGVIDRHTRGSLQRLLGAGSSAPDLASRSLSELIDANGGASPLPETDAGCCGGAGSRSQAIPCASGID
jgi:hypothetical protein